MIIWTFIALVVVLGVKYHTSQEMRKLEQRLKTVKEGLMREKEELQHVQNREDEAKTEEASFAARIRAAKGIIQDLDIRLAAPQFMDASAKQVFDHDPQPCIGHQAETLHHCRVQ